MAAVLEELRRWSGQMKDKADLTALLRSEETIRLHHQELTSLEVSPGRPMSLTGCGVDGAC